MHLRFTSTRDLLQKSCKIFLVGSGAVLFFNGSGFWRIKRIRHWNTGKLCQVGYEKKNNTSSQSEFKNNFSPMLPDYTFLCSDIYIFFGILQVWSRDSANSSRGCAFNKLPCTKFTFLKSREWMEVLQGKMTRGKETATLITNPNLIRSRKRKYHFLNVIGIRADSDHTVLWIRND